MAVGGGVVRGVVHLVCGAACLLPALLLHLAGDPYYQPALLALFGAVFTVVGLTTVSRPASPTTPVLATWVTSATAALLLLMTLTGPPPCYCDLLDCTCGTPQLNTFTWLPLVASLLELGMSCQTVHQALAERTNV